MFFFSARADSTLVQYTIRRMTFHLESILSGFGFILRDDTGLQAGLVNVGIYDMPDDFRASKKRLTGVGPAYLAWEASVLPMYYSRITRIYYGKYEDFSITICI